MEDRTFDKHGIDDSHGSQVFSLVGLLLCWPFEVLARLGRWLNGGK